MTSFATKNTRTKNNVKEHSPIYDLAAYETRQRKLKRKQIIKNILDIAVFFFSCSMAFSLLFWGA